jgi:predicted GNAT family acetyltransferase
MEIQHEDEGKKGEFYVEQDGERVARIQYFDSREGEITVYHTEVDDSLAGQGVGKKLVAKVAEYAREKGVKIRATCSYARKVMSSDDAYADVLSA